MDSPSALELVVRINGHHAAFMSEYGRDVARDRQLHAERHHAANASCSVMLRAPDTGVVLLHLLFDVGLGVVNSLLDASHPARGVELAAVFLTHPHFDHFAELDRLANGMHHAHRMRGERDWLLPVHCTAPCAERVFGERGTLHWLTLPPPRRRVVHQELRPCVPVTFTVAGGTALTVTPVSVFHHESAPGAVIYVVEAGGKKVVLAWDMLRLVEAPEQPWQAAVATFHTALPREHAGLVRDADVLLLDSTTWHPHPAIGHISIREGLALTRAWRARRLYWTHYSGHEDLRDAQTPLNPLIDLPGLTVRRPLTEPEMHWLAGRVSVMLDYDVRYAYPGMTLPDTEPWPEKWPPVFQ